MPAALELQTFEHINRVRKCLFAMAAVTYYDQELIQRSFVHDASKYRHERREYVYYAIALLDQQFGVDTTLP